MKKIYFKNGDTYEGQTNSSGELQGYGEYTYKNGSNYKGDFVRGQFNGKGVLYDSNSKSTIEGNFMSGLPNGFIKICYFNKSEYQGLALQGLRQGQGIFKFPSIHKVLISYEGEFQNDVFEGKGILRLKNKAVYEGLFRQGQIEGKGKLTHPDYTYEGEFKKGQKCDSNGQQIFTNGDKYEGNFMNDLRNGQGQMDYFDGSQYIGEWYEDQRHGNGVLKFVNGDVYQGKFLQNQFSGYGKYTFGKSNSQEDRIKLFEGEFRGGKACGEGKIQFDNSSDFLTGNSIINQFVLFNSCFKGSFQNNMKHGSCKLMIFKNSEESAFGTYKGEFVYDIEKVSQANYGPRI